MQCSLWVFLYPFFDCIYTALNFCNFMHGRRYIALREWMSYFLNDRKRRISTIFLAFAWCFGLWLGSAFARNIDGGHAALILQAADAPVKLIGSLTIVWLPLALGVVFVRFLSPKLLYGLCLLDGALLGAGCRQVALAFGSAAWLIRLLLFFSDLLMIPLLLHFSYVCLSRRQLHRPAAYFVLSALVGCVDYCFVSPFLAMLIEI